MTEHEKPKPADTPDGTGQTPDADEDLALRPVARNNAVSRILGITLFGVVIGIVASLAALLFVATIEFVSAQLASTPNLSSSRTLLLIIATPAVGGLITGLLIQYLLPDARPHGPPDLIRAAQAQRGQMSVRHGLVSSLGALVSMGSGASAGQYGPIACLGGMIGSTFSRLVSAPGLGTIGVGCGAAAGIAAAFNAPIAGLVFAHEVVLRHYSLRAFAPVTVASTMGFVMAKWVFDSQPLFEVPAITVSHPAEYIAFVLTGILGALVAVLFMQTLRHSRKLARSLPVPQWLRPAIAGLVLGVASIWIPNILGIGEEVIRLGISGSGLGTVETAVTLVAKLLAAALCIGFGFLGGVFSPALLMGVLFGGLIGSAVEFIAGDMVSTLAVYAICGMAAVTSPVIGAPLTTILIVFELTGNYDLTTAVMVSVVFSNVVAYRIFGRSWFDKELLADGFDLSLGRDRVILEEHHVDEIVEQTYSRIESFESLDKVRDELVESGHADAYVVDESGHYVGTITINQLLVIADTDAMTSQLAGDIAKPASIILTNGDTIWEAMERIGHFVGETIPVIRADDDNTLIGVVSESSIVRSYLDTIYEIRREEHAAS